MLCRKPSSPGVRYSEPPGSEYLSRRCRAVFKRARQVPFSASACKFDGTRLANDGHLDLARIVQLLLDGLGNVAARLQGLAVVQHAGVGDDAQLAPRLDGVGVLDPREALGQR